MLCAHRTSPTVSGPVDEQRVAYWNSWIVWPSCSSTPPVRFGNVPSPPLGGSGTRYPSGIGTFCVVPDALHAVPGHHWPLSRIGRSGAVGEKITRLFSTAKKVFGSWASTYCALDPIG